jgi:hypothetical protein
MKIKVRILDEIQDTEEKLFTMVNLCLKLLKDDI